MICTHVSTSYIFAHWLGLHFFLCVHFGCLLFSEQCSSKVVYSKVKQMLHNTVQQVISKITTYVFLEV